MQIEGYMLTIEIGMPMFEFIKCIAVSGSD